MRSCWLKRSASWASSAHVTSRAREAAWVVRLARSGVDNVTPFGMRHSTFASARTSQAASQACAVTRLRLVASRAALHASLLRRIAASLRPVGRCQLRRARLQSQQPLKVQRAKQLVHVSVLAVRFGALAIFASERRPARARKRSARGGAHHRHQRAPRRRLGRALAGLKASQLPTRARGGEVGARPRRCARVGLVRLARRSACGRSQDCGGSAAGALQCRWHGPDTRELRTHPEQSAADHGPLQQRARRPRAAAATCAPSESAKLWAL